MPEQPRIRAATWKERALDALKRVGGALLEQPAVRAAGAVGEQIGQGFTGQMGQEDSPWAGPKAGQMVGALPPPRTELRDFGLEDIQTPKPKPAELKRWVEAELGTPGNQGLSTASVDSLWQRYVAEMEAGGMTPNPAAFRRAVESAEKSGEAWLIPHDHPGRATEPFRPLRRGVEPAGHIGWAKKP